MPPKTNKIHDRRVSELITKDKDDTYMRASQSSQEYLNFIFEKNEKSKKTKKFEKNDFTSNKIHPFNPNVNNEILSVHTEPDTEMLRIILNMNFNKYINL